MFSAGFNENEVMRLEADAFLVLDELALAACDNVELVLAVGLRLVDALGRIEP